MKQKFHDRLVFDGGCGNVDVENNGRFQPSVSHSFNLGCEDIPVENKVQGQGKVFFPFSFSCCCCCCFVLLFSRQHSRRARPVAAPRRTFCYSAAPAAFFSADNRPSCVWNRKTRLFVRLLGRSSLLSTGPRDSQFQFFYTFATASNLPEISLFSAALCPTGG